MENTVKSVIKEIALSCGACVLFCLFAEALFALVIGVAAPSVAVMKAVNCCLQVAGAFVGTLAFVRKGRAAFKGMAAGAVGCLATALLFGLIGGGLHFSLFFLLEWVLSVLFGGVGAILGAKVRKER